MRIVANFAALLAVLTGALAPAQTPRGGFANGQGRGGFRFLTSAPIVGPVLASINADGWSGQWINNNPTPALQAVDGSGAGFDANGTATTVARTVRVTTAVRKAYPNYTQLDPPRVALSDYAYAGESFPGITNNSTEASPKPVANWATIDQKVIGNTVGGAVVPVEIVAFHRNGIAAVRYTVSDGSTCTLTQTVSAMAVSPRVTDQNAVLVYALPATNVTSCANQAGLTVNAQVFPRVGTAASVLSSVDATAARDFSPRYFFRDTTKAANPPCVIVNATTGADATVLATGSTSGGVQKVFAGCGSAANPFATFASAATAIRAATTLSGGVTSGAIMRVQGTVANSSGWAAFTYQNTNGGALIIEGDPADANATVSEPTGNVRQTYLLYRNIKLTRSGNTLTHVNRMENVALANGGATALVSSTNYTMVDGLVITGASASVLGNSSEGRLLRGLVSDAGMGVEPHMVLGSLFSQGASFPDTAARPADGGIIAFNRVMRMTSGPFDLAGQRNLLGFALVQNLFEVTTTDNFTTFRFSGDSLLGNTDHMIVWNNTQVSYAGINRLNIYYVDGTFASGAQSRVHKRHSWRGNIWSQVNMKGDRFVAENEGDPTNAPNAVGNWSQRYGVGWVANWTQWIDANGSGVGQGSRFAQDYAGVAANYGTSATVRNDPLFTDYRGTTNSGTTPVAGTGGGTYTLQSGSGAIGLLPSTNAEALPRDLAGNIRDRRSAGAYR